VKYKSLYQLIARNGIKMTILKYAGVNVVSKICEPCVDDLYKDFSSTSEQVDVINELSYQ